jgi:hypothetical protein
MKRIVCVVLLAVLVGLGAGCKDKEAQAELEARNIEVIKTMIAELDKGNAEILLKLYAPDSKCYSPSNSTKPSADDGGAPSKGGQKIHHARDFAEPARSAGGRKRGPRALSRHCLPPQQQFPA